MKKVIVFLFLSVIVCTKLIAQDESFQFKFYPSVHFGFFLNPEDVNAYIENDLSSYSTSFGTTDIILNITVGAGIGFRFANKVELQPIIEYTIGPKVVSGDITISYNFNKFAGGLMANYMLPLGSGGRHSILLGGGMLYSFITFEDYSGNTINPRAQAGVSFNNNKFNPQILLAIDLAKTNADENEDFELNYNSFRFGVNLNF